MALDAVIFDLDGTLLDTNGAHVEAWRRAFESCGFKVPPDRIALEVGKGGDMLVSAVLGLEAERQHGEQLRKASAEEFLKVAGATHFKCMPGALELLEALRARGLKLALATSSKEKHLKATWASAGIDLSEKVDVLVKADDIERSKPSPDAVHATLSKLGLFAAQCAFVGDTPYDARACRQAGVVCMGLTCGGNDEKTLRQGGARSVWRDPADVLAHLDEALQSCSPGTAHWTQERVGGLMREAVAAARQGLAQGEAPDGCVLVGGDGTVLGKSPAGVKQNGPLAHAAHGVLARALRAGRDLRDAGLVCTLEPCLMCSGAAVEARVDTILFALPAVREDGTRRLVPSVSGESPLPRVVGGVLEGEARQLVQEYLRGKPGPEGERWAQRVLEATEGASKG